MKQPQPPLILASSSPYRRELLQRLNLTFRCFSPDIDESIAAGESPSQLARRLALQKAEAIAAEHPDSVVIGSDQVPVRVVGDTVELLNKPGSLAKAREQLRASSGNKVTFITGLAVIAPGIPAQCDTVNTEVLFRQLSDAMIERYLQAEPALNCAGSFKSEALGVSLMRKMDTGDPTALIGLPLIRLCDFLRNAGFELP